VIVVGGALASSLPLGLFDDDDEDEDDDDEDTEE
jgi:hypothetical protein